MADENRWHGGLELLNLEDRLGMFKELSPTMDVHCHS
jgi:hypothetical protein